MLRLQGYIMKMLNQVLDWQNTSVDCIQDVQYKTYMLCYNKSILRNVIDVIV